MRSRLAVAVPALLLAGATILAPTARADEFRTFSNYCTGGMLRTCASVQVGVLTSPEGLTTVVVRVRNLQGTHPLDQSAGLLLSEVGVAFPGQASEYDNQSVGQGVEGSVGIIGAEPLYDFRQFPDGVVFFPIARNQGVAGCEPPAGVPDDGGFPNNYYQTCPGQGLDGWVVFSLTPDDPVAWTAANARVTLTWVDPATGQVNRPVTICTTDQNCFDTSPTVVPEPVSTALLATGLAGLWGAGRLRRKGARSSERAPTA